MSRQFLTGLNLNKNELLNARIQNLPTPPNTPVSGQIYYNNVDNTLRLWDNTKWQIIATGDSVDSAITAAIDALTTSDIEEGSNLYFTDQRAVDALSGENIDASTIHLTQNSLGNNIKVGDDAFIGDIDAPNTINIKGVEDPDAAYVSFGNGDNDNVKIGTSGNGNLELTADLGDINLVPDGSVYINGAEVATQSYVDAAVPDNTDGLSEGTTNKYFTDQRAKNAAAALLTSATQTNISITGTGSGLTITAENGVADSTTDDLTEGTTNLYFTAQRAIDAVTGGGGAGDVYSTPNTIVKRDNWGQSEHDALYVKNNIRFEPYDGGTYYGRIIAANTADLSVEGGDNLLLSANYDVTVTANNGDITLNPDGQVHINATAAITGNANVNGWINSGSNGNWGGLSVYNPDGNEVFRSDSDGVAAKVYGNLEVSPFPGAGYSTLRISSPNDSNAEINAWNNNLILTSDSGASGVYLENDGSTDNRVVTQGGSYTLSNKTLGSNVYLGADLDADGYRIVNLSNPSDPQDAATKAYVDNAAAGLTWKNAVNLLWDDSSAGLTGTSGTLAIDGHTALTSSDQGYRILISSGTNAGIWYYADDGDNWGLTRAEDADVYTELKGATVFVQEGDVYGQSAWTQGNHYITDFTGQSWVQFSGAAQIVAGDGLTKTGNQLDVVGTSNRITVNANSVDIASTYVGQTSITTLGTITTGTWNAGTIAVADGGTGATTAHDARANLGATTKYAVDNPTLTATSGIVSWTVTHNLGTEDVTVQLKDISSKMLVEVDVEITNSNTVTLSWVSSGVVDGAFRVIVVG